MSKRRQPSMAKEVRRGLSRIMTEDMKRLSDQDFYLRSLVLTLKKKGRMLYTRKQVIRMLERMIGEEVKDESVGDV